MSQIDYHGIKATGYEASKVLSNKISEVTDVSHLAPWKKHREKDDQTVFTYNNTEDNRLPPLMLYVSDDAVINLRTTAYGEPTVQAGQADLARKAVPQDESAMEWLQENFTL